MSLTSQEFTEFLQKSDAAGKCCACGKDQWLIPSETGENSCPVDKGRLQLINKDGVLAIPGRGVPIYYVICSNCGFLRLHAAAFIEAKMQPGGENHG